MKLVTARIQDKALFGDSLDYWYEQIEKEIKLDGL